MTDDLTVPAPPGRPETSTPPALRAKAPSRLITVRLAVGLTAGLGACLSSCGDPAIDPAGRTYDTASTPDRPTLNPDMEADWFAYFPGDVLSQISFTQDVQEYVFGRGYRASIDDDGDLQLPGLGTELDLSTLARLCSERPRAEWTEVFGAELGPWFDRVESLENWTLKSWEDSKALLRLKLFTDAVFEETGQDAGSTIAFREIPGLWTAVVLDEPLAEITVPRPALDFWDRPERSVRITAQENTLATVRSDAVSLESRPVDGFDSLILSSLEGPAASAAAHFLDAWPELIGRGGTLLAIPRSDVLYAVPVESPKAAHAIAGLRALARQSRVGAEALSAAVYWRAVDGSFGRFEFDGDDVTPPEGFTSALKK